MSTKQIASSTLWQVGSQAAMAALSIITIKLVVTGLSKELVGNYNSAYSFLQIFGILADFGLYAVAVREVSKAQDKPKMMSALIILRSIITVLSLAAALLIVWILPAWKGTPLPIGVTISSLVPFFTLLAGIQRTVFQVTYKMRYVFIAEVMQRIVAVLIITGIVMMGVRESNELWVYEAFLAAGGVGAVVLFVFSTYYAQKLMPVRLKWDGPMIKSLLMRAAPYGLAYLCTSLYRQTDVTLIALLRPDFEIQNAYYGTALRAVEMAYLIPTFLLNSTLPILIARHEKGEDTRDFVGTIFFAIMLLNTTAFLYSVTWAKPVMQLLTADDYLSSATHAGADTALALLAVPMLLNGIVLFAFYNLLTKHEWKPLVTTLAFGVILSFGLNIILIPQYGFVGAAITSISVHCFLVLLLLPQSLKTLPMRLTKAHMKQWAIYTVLLGGGLYLFAPYLTTNTRTVIGLIISFGLVGLIAYGTKITKVLRV